MLSVAQKKAIYVAVKTSYTVNSEAITCSKIYSNQTMTTFPTIVLYHTDEGNRAQASIGNHLGNGTFGQRSTSTLSVNIYAKQSAGGFDAHRLGADIAKQFYEDVMKNWQSLSSGTVKLQRISPVRNLTNIEQGQGITDISRYQMDISLYYTITW